MDWEAGEDEVNELAAMRDALRVAADRFEDLGDIIKEEGKYENAGFMYASARRCREALGASPGHNATNVPKK